jgi:hypothetical protein
VTLAAGRARPPSSWPAQATFLLIQCFLISVAMERWVLLQCWTNRDRTQVRAVVLRANILSYLLLLIAGSLWTAGSVAKWF